MTGIRPSVQHAWDQTQLWLDDLYSDSTDALFPVESVAAQPVAGEESATRDDSARGAIDDGAVPAEAAGTDSDRPSAPDELTHAGEDLSDQFPLLDTTAVDAASHDTGGEAGSEPPAGTTTNDPATDEYGSWWLQEPPPDDRFDYPDLDPVDLDEPLGPPQSRGRKAHPRASSRRNGHTLPSASPSQGPADFEQGFDAAEDHAWIPHTANPSSAPAATPAAVTTPVPVPAGDQPHREAPRFNKALALSFVAATVVGTIAVTSILLGMRPDPTPDPGMDQDGSTQISVVAAPAPSATADPGDSDIPIPFVASADCPAGSTPAQSVAAGDPSRAWVCVRGGVDGQVLTLDLGRTMLVTALSITPGWVGADATGNDQWLAHRVLTRVQWVFDGDPSTVITQNTGNIRGEAVQPVPGRGVLASKITMIVLQTSRPPADVNPAPTPGGSGNMFDPALPPPGAPLPAAAPTETFSLPGLPTTAASTDPVDTTFAVSAIKVLGHSPA